MNPFWLVRMYHWVRNPPSPGAVKFVLIIVAVCLVLFAIERIWGWPELLTPNSRGGRQMW
jgi:hypothetical protein